MKEIFEWLKELIMQGISIIVFIIVLFFTLLVILLIFALIWRLLGKWIINLFIFILT